MTGLGVASRRASGCPYEGPRARSAERFVPQARSRGSRIAWLGSRSQQADDTALVGRPWRLREAIGELR